MTLPDTYEKLRKQTFEEEGSSYPGKMLVKLELEPGYERTKKRLLPYIQTINEAHTVMLLEQGIISREDAKSILEALASDDLEFYKETTYNGDYEDLYFYMESRLIQASNGAAGNMHLGRSRNDMCVAWSHMAIRQQIIEVMEKLLLLQNCVLRFAEEHKGTLCVIHTHTQHAQPSLFGHYFLGFFDVLDRDFQRFEAAYGTTNRSPMGAAAVTTTGFQLSRERVAELSGFSGIIDNAYDSIGNSDYFTETASVAGLCALNMGRVVTDLVLWATQEMNILRLSDGYISTSSIMPQKRNPIALEHLRSSLSVVKGLGDTILNGFFKSPYGDISDYEDLEDSMYQCLSLLEDNIQLMNVVISTMDVNTELLEKRAYDSFSVVTEIADQMYRSYHIPFRKAHSFVSFMVKKAEKKTYGLQNISEEFFAETYEEFFGAKFEESFQPIREAIDPWHFVKCRNVRGGTGDSAMEEMIRKAQRHLDDNCKWLEKQKKHLEEAEEKLKKKTAEIRK